MSIHDRIKYDQMKDQEMRSSSEIMREVFGSEFSIWWFLPVETNLRITMEKEYF